MFIALVDVHNTLRDVPDLGEISDLIDDPEALLWLDLEAASAEEFGCLGTEFGFHPLSVEDVQHGHQRPKIDEFDHYYFAVLYSLSYEPAGPDGVRKLEMGEVGIFIGKNYLITVHQGPVAELTEVRRRWRENPAAVRAGRVGFLLYNICDMLVDHYFPVMDQVEDAIDQLEEKTFLSFQRDTIADIFRLRRDLLALRKVIGPERDVFHILTRRDLPVLDKANAVNLSDVYDHILRIMEMIDTFRDLLTGALDGYLSIQANNLNGVMKVMTAWSIILMTASLIAGIYGMNFKIIPELQWTFGYPYALALMVGSALALLVYFRGRRWL